jgi:transcriptional regulator with XRE-family HTH domain
MELREYLFRKRMTLTSFCETINYDITYISKIMNGARKPGKHLAKMIELATNGEVKAEELLKGK